MVINRRFPQSFDKFRSLIIVISGLVAGTVFTTGLCGWLLPLFLLPWFYYASRSGVKWRDGLWLAAWFFLPFHGVVLSWFLDTNVSGLIGVGRNMALAAQLISWLIMVAVLTLCMLPIGYVVSRLRPLASPHWQTFLVLPAAWVVCEWLRSVGFSVFLYGPGGTLGDYWNFGSLGLGLMNTPLAYLSRLVGLYGLSFMAVLLAIGLYQAIFRKKYVLLGLTLVAGLTLSLAIVMVTNRQNRPALAAPSQPASVLQRSLDVIDYRLDTPIQDATPTKKDLIVLPEYSEVFAPGFTNFADTLVTQRLASDGVSIDVDRGPTANWYGTLEFRGPTGQIAHSDTKQLLIPTGEYMPGILSAFYRVTRQTNIINRFQERRRVYRGDPPVVNRTPKLTIGSVACSGILGRPIYQKLTRDGATVLTNSASLVDFNGSKSYFRQSLLMARFHAIANNRPFIQSSLGAPAFVIDNNGRYIVKPISRDTRFIDFSFHPLSSKTLYTKLGEWPLLFSFGSLAIFGLKRLSKITRP